MISQKCPAFQSWTEFLLALAGARGARGAGFSKNFSAEKTADSPHLIQTKSTTGIP